MTIRHPDYVGFWDTAEKTMQNSPSSLPSYPLLADAKLLVEQEEYERAASLLIKHVKRHPKEPRGLAQLGFVAMQLGALNQADEFLRRAIANGARDVDVKRNLTGVIIKQERTGLALQMVDALYRETQDHTFRGLYANLLEKIGKNDEALAIQEQVCDQHPEFAPAWLAYGHYLRAAGRVDDAIKAYRHAIELEPIFGDAWWGLASIKRPVLSDDDVFAMQSALNEAKDVGHSAPLNFALGRAHHDRREYQTAFLHYEEGNRLRAQDMRYDSKELSSEVEEIERTANADFISRMPNVSVGQEMPVFIVSLPRSGSTLLEQMLGSHSDIEPVGELPYIPAILRTYMEGITRQRRITVTQAIAEMDDRMAIAMGQDYLQRTALHRTSDRLFFIDKLPQNWSNVLFIRRILPQARFIDIRRPAMDCCFSNFTQSFTQIHAASFALRDVGQNYVDNVRLMSHLDRVAPGLVHHVDYEVLVEDAQSQLRPALDYLGLDWDDAILNFHRHERVIRTPSSEQVRRPLNRDGMAVWEPYSQWLGPLRDTLGELA
ncbi:MAG: sulfotransferase [Sphingomonadaceae bacterium]